MTTHFVGLAIHEDRQPELTAQRVEKWVKHILQEMDRPIFNAHGDAA